jgi:hypothetical protein
MVRAREDKFIQYIINTMVNMFKDSESKLYDSSQTSEFLM